MDQVLTNDQFFSQLGDLLGGSHGVAYSVAALVLVKVAALAFKWKLGEFVGVWKLSIISGLTVLTIILVNLNNGIPPFGAVVNGTVFAAISVFMNNFWAQWKKREADRAEAMAVKLVNAQKANTTPPPPQGGIQ